jgi:ribonuclease-3
VIGKLFEPVLKTVDPKTLGKDSKTLLQEYLQGKRIALPVYTVVETRGAAHNQEFEVECSIPKLEISVRGTGKSRRAAEQSAAKRALETSQQAMAQLGRRPRKKAVHAEAAPVEPSVASEAPAASSQGAVVQPADQT